MTATFPTTCSTIPGARGELAERVLSASSLLRGTSPPPAAALLVPSDHTGAGKFVWLYKKQDIHRKNTQSYANPWITLALKSLRVTNLQLVSSSRFKLNWMFLADEVTQREYAAI